MTQFPQTTPHLSIASSSIIIIIPHSRNQVDEDCAEKKRKIKSIGIGSQYLST